MVAINSFAFMGIPENRDRSILPGLLHRYCRILSRYHNLWNCWQQPVTVQSFEYDQPVSDVRNEDGLRRSCRLPAINQGLRIMVKNQMVSRSILAALSTGSWLGAPALPLG